MSFAIQLLSIINSNYDISNINQFIENNKEFLNLESECFEDVDTAVKEILNYFKIIESPEDYPVSNDDIKKLYTKPLNLKNLQKSFNMQEMEYIISKDNEEEFKFTYGFFKKVLSILNLDRFNILCKVESIISVDIIKKSLECKNISSEKPKNIMLGLLLKSINNNVIMIEFAKIKKTKIADLHELVSDKEIILQFSFDKDIDNIKIFDESIKQLFSDKVDIINRKKEREVDSQNLKIKESLDNLDKEERKLKEKDLLLKHCKVSMKSLGIQIKSTSLTYPDTNDFELNEIVNIIKNKLNSYNSLEIIENIDSGMKKEEEIVDNEKKIADDTQETEEVMGNEEAMENEEMQIEEKDEEESDNEDLFGL